MNSDDIKAAANRLATAKLMSDRFENDIHIVCNWVESHPYGVLKPLEWVTRGGDGIYRTCDTIIGQFVIDSKPSAWIGDRCLCGMVDDERLTVEDAHQRCETFYAAEMAKAFTPIGWQP